MKPLLNFMVDTLLPLHCLACDTPVAAEGQFCATCFRAANFISAPYCKRCGVPLPFAGAAGPSGVCGTCEAAPPAFASARAALRYDTMAQKILLPFKYGDRPEFSRGLARLILPAGWELLEQADLLLPVPLHVSRLRARRYNQAALLASALGRLTSRTCVPDALIRQKATAPLAGMGLAERRAELSDAIVLRQGVAVEGLRILLVDDIMTSGTTADTCARILLAAGAMRVDVLTAARVEDPRAL